MHAEPASHALPYLGDVLVLLAAGLAAAPVCRRLGLSPVIGYLLAGVALGPGGFKVVADAEGVRSIAELGVIFLLFSIGLELSLERLRTLRYFIFGLGAAQLTVTAAVVAAIAYAWGNGGGAAIVLGACFAFSSTAIAVQLLTERRELASPAGRVAFSILLFQDLAVAPTLLLIQILGDSTDGVSGVALALGEAVLRAVVAVVVIVLVGRLVVRRVFHVIASERSADLFMGLVVLSALLTAWATEQAGLSAVLGAFLAGLLLAETEYRAQIETDIEPFRGLLLGLFFIGVGMTLDPSAALATPLRLIASIAGLAVFKAAIIFVLALLFRSRVAEAVRVSLLLSQAGEFGFVVVAAALVVGILPEDVGQFMSLVIAGSMLVAPLTDIMGRALAGAVSRPKDRAQAATAAAGGHVVIAGYGRVGRLIAGALSDCNAPWVAVERDAGVVVQARTANEPVLFGDAARVELLERAGLANATAFVITLDDPIAAERAVSAVRARGRDVPIIARARDAAAADRLTRAGAQDVILESVEPAVQMARSALGHLDAPQADVDAMVQTLRGREAA